MPFWSDLYNTWAQQGQLDPISRRVVLKEPEGAAVLSPEVIQDIRNSGEFFGGSRGVIRMRETGDFLDMSSITNRTSRYKEYERLRTVPEIENAMTVFADEACVSGTTQVATPFGYFPIWDLAENRRPDEKYLVYCYDFTKRDYTLGWAHHARFIKNARTVIVQTDCGRMNCTPDHLVLMRDGEWKEAGKLEVGDDLMPFYRQRHNAAYNRHRHEQYPRIWTHNHGWIWEKDFLNLWKGLPLTEEAETIYKVVRCFTSGLSSSQTAKIIKSTFARERMYKFGFTVNELKALGVRKDRRQVVALWKGREQRVFDISVDKHENFCTDVGVMHNCQIGENGHMFEVECKNQDIRQELEHLFFHPRMLNMDDHIWSWCRDLFIFGDHFVELVIDPAEPKAGILKATSLPPESVYRIETVKGKVVEFQQSKDGPDYTSLAKVDVTKATEAELATATALRFHPDSIVHFRIGGNRKTFYPYGVSLIEAARGPAHTLKLMEESTVIYRLCLVGGTVVKTPTGWKRIRDLGLGDEVVCCPTPGETRTTRVTAKANNGVKPVVRVRTRHHYLVGTDNHPVLVFRDGTFLYVDIKDLRVGKDRLVSLGQGFDQVMSVEPEGEAEVFDISVADPCHNFVANGVVVHNSRAPERRVFYLDVGQMSPARVQAFMQQSKDALRKKKTFSGKGGAYGANQVEERWSPMSVDEDIWLPVKANSSTRVDTLPGAQSLGEVDDVLYFRNKLFISMFFPKNYMAQEDPSITRVTLSSIDVKFSRLVERLQRNVATGLTDIATRHLKVMGYPPQLFEDLKIKMTAPSHHREVSENEVKDARVNRLATLKGTMVYSDLDLLTDIMQVPLEKAKEIVARSMIQKLQELKLQVISQNPQLMGIAMPGPGENEMGTDADGPHPELAGDQAAPPPAGMDSGDGQSAQDTYGKPPKTQGKPLPEPSEDDILRFDMEIADYSEDIDEEEIDAIEADE